MANNNLCVDILAGTNLLIDKPGKHDSDPLTIVNRDVIQTPLPGGMHIVALDGTEYIVENISPTQVFSIRLTEGTKYFSKKKRITKELIDEMTTYFPLNSQLALPALTVVQKLESDGTVQVTTLPEASTVRYVGTLNTTSSFADLCQPIVKTQGQIITIDSDGLLRIANPITGKWLQTLLVDRHHSHSKVSPNGRYICFYSCEQVKLHDLSTRKTFTLPRSYRYNTSCVCFSADSQKLVRVSRNIIEIWSTTDNSMISSMDAKTGRIDTVQFYCGDQQILISTQKAIMICDIATLQYIAAYDMSSLWYTVDKVIGSVIGRVCFLTRQGRPSIWNPSKKWFNVTKSLDLDANTIDVSLDGKLLAVCRPGSVPIVDVLTGKTIKIITTTHYGQHSGKPNVMFSSDSQHILVYCGSQLKTYRVFDGVELTTLNYGTGIKIAHWCG